jgi:hypothetical protein
MVDMKKIKNKKKQTKLIGVTLIVVAILIISGIFSYFVYFKEEEKKNIIEEIVVDDQISPYTNQGLIVEILRIRHRGLLDKMLTFGRSWRATPSFYWISEVDGEECITKGHIGETGVYTDWDTFDKESHVNYYVEEEQERSIVNIKIIEIVKKGLLGLRKSEIERETIRLTYDYRTGRWYGDDYFKDKDGYGHYLGETFEIWFNIYQSDYDHDGIPYWTEVNLLGTDPSIDDSKLDPDKDGIPTSWEWKWNYDPLVWNDHQNLDPDIDGIENIEEYNLAKWFSNPFQPDVYIETDGMEKKGIFDFQHIFFEESQQMLIERFAQHGINVYIDDGWADGPINGGGELVPFHKDFDDVSGKQLLRFYNNNFADERKGVFRYLLIGNQKDYSSGFICPGKYNSFDAILCGSGVKKVLLTRTSFTPRTFRLTLASAAMHELGHSLGLLPYTFPGNDIQKPKAGVRYPSMPEDEYLSYLEKYESVMNYDYIYSKKLFDYSDGSNGPPYDQNDWDYLYIPTFQVDSIVFETPADETFEDFEAIDDYPGIIANGWEFNENLTIKNTEKLKHFAKVKNADVNISIYTKAKKDIENEYDVRIYSMPKVYPVYSIWSLVAEGNIDSEGNIQIYSQQDIIDEIS